MIAEIIIGISRFVVRRFGKYKESSGYSQQRDLCLERLLEKTRVKVVARPQGR